MDKVSLPLIKKNSLDFLLFNDSLGFFYKLSGHTMNSWSCLILLYADWLTQYPFTQSAASVSQVHVGMVERVKKTVTPTNAFVFQDLKEAIVKVGGFFYVLQNAK